MRLVDLVGSAAPIVGVVVGALMAVRRRLVRHYESRAAFGPESAVAAPVSRLPLTGWWRQRLRAAQVLGALPDGREWLDVQRWDGYRRARRRRALAVVLL
ncbi:MAG TPA: hypothetical protein VMV01_20995, partial [Planctomycetota bacterium]|nr:hypothetical protein [Planctomycetota bacterium]